MCSVKKKTQVAELLEQTDLIICDAAPTNDCKCLGTIERTSRDIMDTVAASADNGMLYFLPLFLSCFFVVAVKNVF